MKNNDNNSHEPSSQVKLYPVILLEKYPVAAL